MGNPCEGGSVRLIEFHSIVCAAFLKPGEA